MNKYALFHTRADFLNLDVTAINRLPAHALWDQPEHTLNLNGTWRFKLCDCPENAGEFYLPGFDDAGFADIPVPANWELHGPKSNINKPLYTNIVYPFGEECLIQANKDAPPIVNPPEVPCANPTGCYRRVFEVPENFAGRKVFLQFCGVETAYYVWLNGKPVGYGEDSKLPGEYEVTDFLQPGQNLLALQVMRFGTSTYLEDQDYWYLSGIHRDVALIAKPHLHIFDYKVIAEPDLHTGIGNVSVDVDVARVEGFADCIVKAELYNSDGVCVAQGQSIVVAEAAFLQKDQPTAAAARVQMRVENAALWCPDSPALYTIKINLYKENKLIDNESCKIGFKKIEVINGVVHLNGVRLLVLGVNRHEHAWHYGRAVPREHMIEEILLMKRLNINAVRTSHYPCSPEWYRLCDEYGLLVMCEANLETHGVMGQLTHDPAWAMAFLERAARMARFFKNHSCIFCWSLGNESGSGPNHAAMFGWIKEYDPTRLCQYEAGHPEKNISDTRGWMYAPIDTIMAMLCEENDTRPIVLVEFLYQIRNSGGGLEYFVDLTQKYRRFQGGFVWDWQDKALNCDG
ncbi:MAG: glycoside hydrolase family 2, partial [Clostridia bacterium]|nr:glycoside hydrolase family 2 [Clostridia bacterium]